MASQIDKRFREIAILAFETGTADWTILFEDLDFLRRAPKLCVTEDDYLVLASLALHVPIADFSEFILDVCEACFHSPFENARMTAVLALGRICRRIDVEKLKMLVELARNDSCETVRKNADIIFPRGQPKK